VVVTDLQKEGYIDRLMEEKSRGDDDKNLFSGLQSETLCVAAML